MARPEKRRLMSEAQINRALATALLIGGAVVTALAMIAPHPDEVNVRGHLALIVIMLIGARIVWRQGPRAAKWIPTVILLSAIGLVTASGFLNGEYNGGPPISTELYFVWPALIAGYFFHRVGIALGLLAIAVAEALVLRKIGVPTEAATTRWINTVAVASGAALIVRALRSWVDSLTSRLRELARTDSLTAVLNRRGFDERFDLERRRAARTGEPLSLVVADLDHFKSVNDARGHAAGDAVLQRCAELIESSCRQIDAVARTGGEEFAILMPGTDEDSAFDAAERIRRALEEDARANGGVTVSIGVAQLASADETADALTYRTDEALYAAKGAGRNRTMRAAPAIG